MSVTVNGSSGLTFNDGSTQNTSPFTGGLGFRNRIINGDFRIDQRNAGASVNNGAGGSYSLDRWRMYGDVATKFSVQQNAGSITPPVGFNSYLGATSLSAYSVPTAETYLLTQPIEGLNVSDLGWGTANASTVTLSFWVRSSLTGTFGGAISNSGYARNYPFSFTISSANTWEQKSVTITGDTTGTWLKTNGIGIVVGFSLGVGSGSVATAGSWTSSFAVAPTGATNVVGTNGATFYITGVQLEKGSTATSFDYRPYTTELQLCQRYYWRIQSETAALGYAGIGTGTAITSTGCFMIQKTPVRMRASPTLSFNGAIAIYPGGSLSAIANTYSSTSNDTIFAQFTTSGLSGAGQSITVYASNTTNDWFAASAEL